ncbi:MAG: hypothetical protein LBQ15_03030 [Clostridium sp.]|jgi:hypothetical protein|nr:hypothetical protein [Clostridium sp.]
MKIQKTLRTACVLLGTLSLLLSCAGCAGRKGGQAPGGISGEASRETSGGLSGGDSGETSRETPGEDSGVVSGGDSAGVSREIFHITSDVIPGSEDAAEPAFRTASVGEALFEPAWPLPDNAAPLAFFDDGSVLYTLSIRPDPEHPEYTEQIAGLFDLRSGENVELARYLPLHFGLNCSTLTDSRLYMVTRTAAGTEQLLEVDIGTRESRTVLDFPDDAAHGINAVRNIYAAGEDLLLLQLNNRPQPEKWNYTLAWIDLPGGVLRPVESDFSAPGKYSCIWPCVPAGADRIYFYTECNDGGEGRRFAIQRYDADGRKDGEFPLDLSGFADVPIFADIIGDTVFDFYVQGGYFVLGTINRRVCVLKRDGDAFLPVTVPKALYARMPSDSHYMRYPGPDAESLYFMDSDLSAPTLYKLDAASETFEAFRLPPPGDSQGYFYYYRNRRGDILRKCFDSDEETYTTKETYAILAAEKLQI